MPGRTIQTNRFGEIEVGDKKLLYFEEGLLGFRYFRHYALIESANSPDYFFWLQSTEKPDLSLLVTDPKWWFPDYELSIPPRVCSQIGTTSQEDIAVLVILNTRRPPDVTANLQAPLLVNPENGRGMHVNIHNKRYTTRHPIRGLSPEQFS